jgi:hypothetical protein
MRILTEPAGDVGRSPELPVDVRVHGTELISSEQLASLLEQIGCTTRDAEKLVSGRSQAHLNTNLLLGSWSVAECFDHLAQTTLAFHPAISHAVAAAPSLAANRPLRTGTLARLFIRHLEPPYRLRYRVLAQIAPQRQDFEAAWSSFVESQSQLSETVRSAIGLAIDRVRIKSPVYARISYNVYGALRMLTAHQRRHIWQVEQIFKVLDRRHEPGNVA